jgi:voltage-gated sodium channel
MRRSIESNADGNMETMPGRPSVFGRDEGQGFMKDLVQMAMHLQQKAKDLYFGKEEVAPTVEEQKMTEMSNIILTYRGIGDENDEIADDGLVWCDKPWFDVVMSLIIVLNTVVIGLETDIRGADTENREGYWILLEFLFAIAFCAEIAIKVRCHHMWLWIWLVQDKSNVFTFLIALMAFIDCVILQPLSLGGNLRVVSLLRIIGLLRLLRLIKQYKALEELQLVLHGLVESFKMLVWTVLLLIMLLYICAVFLTKQIGHNSDVYGDYKKLSGGWDHEEFFGTVGRSMYTLLQVMTMDSWSSGIVRHVMANQIYMMLFFMLFVFLSTLGIMNIVVAIIVGQMLTASQNNEKKNRVRQERQRKQELDSIKEIFVMSDADGNGQLELREFNDAVKNPEVLWRMRQLELPVADAAKLFSVIDGEGSRELSIEEFIAGCHKLKGVAQSKDLLGIQAQADVLGQKMDKLIDALGDGERMMGALDEITMRIDRRFDSAVVGSRRKMARSVGGTKPMVPPPNEGPSGDLVPLSIGNRPALPAFPDLT